MAQYDLSFKDAVAAAMDFFWEAFTNCVSPIELLRRKGDAMSEAIRARLRDTMLTPPGEERAA